MVKGAGRGLAGDCGRGGPAGGVGERTEKRPKWLIEMFWGSAGCEALAFPKHF